MSEAEFLVENIRTRANLFLSCLSKYTFSYSIHYLEFKPLRRIKGQLVHENSALPVVNPLNQAKNIHVVLTSPQLKFEANRSRGS